MNSPTLTGAYTYTCTHHNDMRAECPVCLLAALTAERDQLRAALAVAQSTDTKPLLTGKLTNAGSVMVCDEIIDGVFIAIDHEQIRALPQLPMYRRIELRVAAMQEAAK